MDSRLILDPRPPLVTEPELLVELPGKKQLPPMLPTFINTNEFRREALHFEKHGRYCDYPKGSRGYEEYWLEQTRRCHPDGPGYTVGGVTVTGDHYAYLNFGQIRLTKNAAKDPTIAREAKKRQKGTKHVFFPDFWDGDWYYFTEVKKARDDGEHMIVLKSRRRGYSFKNGFIVANRYNFIPNSISIIGAYTKDFLYPEGTMEMASSYLNFFNQHTAWRKRRIVFNRVNHKKASYLETIDGVEVEKGYKSQIIAVTFKDNPSAARGKDGTLVLLEEAGRFPNLKASINATLPTLQDGIYTTGMLLVFGTGGGESDNWADFEDVFYNPAKFGFKSYQNVYDDNAETSVCGFYTPDYINRVGFIDENGNSNKAAAWQYEVDYVEQMRADNATSADIDGRVAEYSHSPAQAFLRSSSNLFPSATILEHLNRLKSNKSLMSIGVAGDFAELENGLRFIPDPKLSPVYKFPHVKGDKTEGCVVIYASPVRDSATGVVPSDLYYICHDPYAQGASLSGESLGATYILKRDHPRYLPGDIVVASYVGRPAEQDDYNRRLFQLARYYNCKIGFENDRGDVISYAKRTRQLHLLEEEFELDYVKELKSAVNRSYGMHMTEGRKRQGVLYLRDWLTRLRTVSADGKRRLNLHYIYDPALLEELLKWSPDPKANFDRVSALIVGMYYQKELEFELEQQMKTPPAKRESFLTREWFR